MVRENAGDTHMVTYHLTLSCLRIFLQSPSSNTTHNITTLDRNQTKCEGGILWRSRGDTHITEPLAVEVCVYPASILVLLKEMSSPNTISNTTQV